MTVCKCACIDFANVFLTCAAHSIHFTVLLWGAEFTSPPEQLSQALQRLLCEGGTPFFQSVGYKCLSQLIQELPPLVLLIIPH